MRLNLENVMNTKGRLMLRVLLNTYHPKNSDALYKFMSKEEAQQILSQDIRSTDVKPILYQPQRVLERMHYSWLQPFLENFPSHLQPLIMASLTKEQTAGFSSSSAPLTLAEPVKNFMIHYLYSHLQTEDLLPLEYLPETELSPIAQWSKGRLVTLIDFLGLHDLAAEIRHIVNPNYLKNLYACLSPRQLAYLKVCLHQKEKLVPPKLGIDASKEDCPRLKQILHRRGIVRLAKALSGQHPDLVWYIAHILDVGRGKFLLQQYEEKAIPEITTALKLQVTNVINFLKKE